jgi:DNA repair exonuclease SbcCD nuclease subunit
MKAGFRYMVKILLTSDIHLGLDDDDAPVPGAVRAGTFRKIAALAREHDVLLVAGDLFCRSDVDAEIVDLVSEEFGKIRNRETEILLTPGECEMDAEGAAASSLNLLNVSRIFDESSSEPFVITRGGQSVYVYGVPPLNGSAMQNISRQSNEGFHIGLFHGDINLNGEEMNDCPLVITRQDLKRMNLDFYALGHYHNYKLYKNLGVVIGAYPGSPEAVTFGEPGERYVLSMIVGSDRIQQIKRLTINSKVVEVLDLDCSVLGSARDVLKKLEECCSPKKICQLRLTGERNFILTPDEIAAAGKGFDNLILCDESLPTIEVLIRNYKNENTLKGDFFSVLEERFGNNDIPADIDPEGFNRILNRISGSGFYKPEDWLCR